MSIPPIDPAKTAAGIAVDPQTLERVIPESRRPDGTVRKQIKIRPGFTPQEDVRRFRGTKQAQMDTNVLPKGHIVGWAPPPTSAAASGSAAKPMSKSAKKNAKRREKKEEKKGEPVKDNWEDDDDEGGSAPAPAAKSEDSGPDATPTSNTTSQHTSEQPNWAAAPGAAVSSEQQPSTITETIDDLSSELNKLIVK